MRRTQTHGAADELPAEESLPSRLLATSTGLGWRGMHARLYRDPPETEPFTTTQSQNLLVVVVTSGAYTIECRKGPVWRRADYFPGVSGLTAPGNVSVLRWRSASTVPLESVHMRLSAALLAETIEELGRTAPGAVDRFPDTLLVDDPVVAAIGQAVARALRGGAPALYADSAARMLAVHLLGRPVLEDGAVTGRGAIGAAKLRRVTGYMREHLHDDVRLDDLAALANMSKYHFVRTFAQTTGLTPHRYLTRLRMRSAAAMLRESDLSALQISVACGYRSPGQFAAAFRREYGVSPSEFRLSTRERPAAPPDPRPDPTGR